MNTYATIIVRDSNKALAQEVISELHGDSSGLNLFKIELKGSFNRKYWTSYGPFLTEEFEALEASGLTFIIEEGQDYSSVFALNNFTKVVVEEK
tara:strand:+ start:737 stop:1018 length:282 start_codon:yes stop_codon:yes gene_type:complete